MSKLPYRQVHLDFHTSECIEGIGSRFSEENFAAALRVGHVNSITLFSKCHHGWAYHPSKANEIHPHLDFDLLGAQLKVCRELGIRAQIYLSVGFDEKYARKHPDHLRRWKGGVLSVPDGQPGYHHICFNTPYLDVFCDQLAEVMDRYAGQFDGIFLDIVGATPCHCEHCRASMKEQGMDPENDVAVWEFAKKVYQHYCDRVDEVVLSRIPDMPIIHNDGGAIYQGRAVALRNTQHLELESLPTGGWGYDHFPRAAAYARVLGKEFLGMTGKFHKGWGEFGGYKHPNALRYEVALSNANGAKCSVGDQLHPDGEFDLATYRLIGAGYSEVEAREPWLTDSVSVADIGVISAEACVNGAYHADFNWHDIAAEKWRQDFGANRMMLEGHYLYNIIDPECDFSGYKLLILPDGINVDGRFKEKLEAYLKQGGKLLLSGKSGVGRDGSFAFDFGAEFCGVGEFQPTYLRPAEGHPLYPNGVTSYIMYGKDYSIRLKEDFKGEVFASRVDPYFNRTLEHFCSHLHTPYDRAKVSPAAVLTDSIGYIGWNIFTEYAEMGAVHLRSQVELMIDALLGKDITLTTSLPSMGIVSLMEQPTKTGIRLINHLLYAIPKVRGKNTEIIEDIPTVLDTKVSIKCGKKPSRIYLAPEGKDLDFVYEDGTVSYTVDKFECAQLVAIEF